jgi:ABC-type nitrate/sulfonate/bicarbonate transport system substrate-binding protein
VRKASEWANQHPVESGDILIKYSKMDPALMHSMARSVNATTLDAALVQPELDVAAKYGAIEHSFPASEILWSPPK